MSATGASDLIWGATPLFRKPGTTRAQFRQNWLHHGQLVAPWFLKYGPKNYSQIHMPDSPSRALDAEDQKLLEQIDGIAVLQLRPQVVALMTAGTPNKYFEIVVKHDERRFLHEESGASAIKPDQPAFVIPAKTVTEWQEWALGLGGTEHRVVVDGKAVIEIPREIIDEWERYEEKE